MSKPGSQPDPRRQQSQPQAANPPGIINDLQGQNPPAGNQSMIINDLYPAGTAPQQQMIINDVPSGAGRSAGQQMVVNDGRYPQNAGGAQQMIVNDMAFSDLVKGLEALTKGELPAGGQMIVNDMTGSRQGAAGAPAPRPVQQVPARLPAPGNAVGQPGMQQASRPMQPQQAIVQRQVPQPNVPQQQVQIPRQAGQVDPRLVARQQAQQQQPMVINTPQPLAKPRREEVGAGAQAGAAAPFRIIQDDSPRGGTGQASAPAGQPAASPRAERKAAAAAKKSAQKAEAAKGKAAAGEEWKGCYAGRAMMPSHILCIGLSAGLVWLSLRYLPREWLMEVLLAGLGAIWVMQLVRWGYRAWLYRYRLTSDHLFLHRGLLYGRPVQVPRCEILKVSVSANLIEKILGVGKIVIESQPARDGKPSTVELEGVRSPTEIVQKIGKKAKAG